MTSLLGLGTALPPHRIAQADSADLAAQVFSCDPQEQKLLPFLYRRTGVAHRHSVLLNDSAGDVGSRQEFYPQAEDASERGPATSTRMACYQQTASDLALASSTAALEQAGVEPEQITDLVTVSCTGFAAPGVDIDLVERLPLSRDVSRTHVGFMGCHGAMNGLRVAAGTLARNPSATVLLCATELCSLHYQYNAPRDQAVANALFADGSGAVVLGGEAGNSAGDSTWRLLDSGSHIVPESRQMMSWSVGDNGFAMTLSTDLPDLIREQLRPWMTDWLARSNLTVDQIGTWAVHPGGPKILQAVEQTLEITPDDLRHSYEVLSDCGNMSSATMLFLLERLTRAHAPRPCVGLGFGPGITIEAALFG